jgi:hypothetical protein
MRYQVAIVGLDQRGNTIDAGTIKWTCGGSLNGSGDGSTGSFTHKVEISELGEQLYMATSSKGVSLKAPLVLPGLGTPKRFHLVAKRILTDFSTGKAVHTIALLTLDAQDKEFDPGKDLKASWTLGKKGGKATLTKGSALVQIEIADPEVQVAFNAVCADPILSLDQPLTLSGPPKTEPPKLKVVRRKDRDWTTLTITYGVGESHTKATFTMWPTRGCRIAHREEGETKWKTATGKTEIPTTGKTVQQVKIDKLAPGVGGDNVFVRVKKSTLQSGPHYVSGNP